MEGQWYVARNGKRIGPFSKFYIQEKINKKQLLENDLLWHESFGDKWKQFTDCKQYFKNGHINTSNLVESKVIAKFDYTVGNYFKLDSQYLKNLILIFTGAGLSSAFLPWKSMGIFSLNNLQIVNGWFFMTPFIATAFWLALNWKNFERLPNYLGLFSLIICSMLVASYDQFTVTMPFLNSDDDDWSFSKQSRNVAGIGYYFSGFCLFGLALCSMSAMPYKK